MYETDRSGWVEWKAYKGENEAESAQRMCHDDTIYFESRIRKQPRGLDKIEDKNVLRSRLDNLVGLGRFIGYVFADFLGVRNTHYIIRRGRYIRCFWL